MLLLTFIPKILKLIILIFFFYFDVSSEFAYSPRVYVASTSKPCVWGHLETAEQNFSVTACWCVVQVVAPLCVWVRHSVLPLRLFNSCCVSVVGNSLIVVVFFLFPQQSCHFWTTRCSTQWNQACQRTQTLLRWWIYLPDSIYYTL